MKALGDADFARKLSDVGAEPGSLSGAAFGTFLRAETEKWGKVIKDSGAVMQ
jgi:tripartite-type tricarboxylate transporter receptor subunit TctC